MVEFEFTGFDSRTLRYVRVGSRRRTSGGVESIPVEIKSKTFFTVMERRKTRTGTRESGV